MGADVGNYVSEHGGHFTGLMPNCIAAPKVHGSSRVHSDSVTGQRTRSLVHRIVH